MRLDFYMSIKNNIDVDEADSTSEKVLKKALLKAKGIDEDDVESAVLKKALLKEDTTNEIKTKLKEAEYEAEAA